MNPRLPLVLVPDITWLREPPPPQLVNGFLPAGALAGIAGAPGTGKTFLGISLATAVGIATDWLGRQIVGGGPVVYAVGEGHAAFPRRLQAVRASHGVAEDEPAGVWYMREPLSLLNPDDVTALLDAARPLAPRLFVFDPLAAFTAGGDENSARDMGAVVAALHRIRTDTCATVLVTHHTGWNQDRERGSTALRAALDVLYSVKLEDAVLTLECVKLRDGTPPAPLVLRLKPLGDSCTVEIGDATADTVALTRKQRQAVEALERIVVDEEGISYSRWKEASRLAPTTFDEALVVLVRGHKVSKSGKGRSARYSPSPNGHPGPRTHPADTPPGVAVYDPGNPGGSLDPGVRGNGPGFENPEARYGL